MNATNQGLARADAPPLRAIEDDARIGETAHACSPPVPFDEDDDHPFPAFVGLRNALLLMGGAAVVVIGLVALARGCAS